MYTSRECEYVVITTVTTPAVVLCALSVAGVSHSGTLVVVYIMTVIGRGWVESLAAVRAAQPFAGPNLGFLQQLEEFENTELAEVSAWLCAHLALKQNQE